MRLTKRLLPLQAHLRSNESLMNTTPPLYNGSHINSMECNRMIRSLGTPSLMSSQERTTAIQRPTAN